MIQFTGGHKMRRIFVLQAVLGIFLIPQYAVCFAAETPDANDSSKYLDAVREFADNVLKYGRDTYGPKHTPLFVDGLNINTQEPVKEPQKVEAPIENKDKLNESLLSYAAGLTTSSPSIKTILINNIKKALSQGADVNTVDEYGLTPLHYAVNQGHINIVKLLIAQGACLDVKDNAGRAPIHYAAEANYRSPNPQKWSVGMVQLLLDAGADINAKDDIGWTPLYYAACNFKKYLIELLVARGADIDVADNRGRTPFEVIQERVIHLETIRGSAFESSIYRSLKRDLKKEVGDVARLLYKNGCTYVVANHGKDTNPGTPQSPLRTIIAAIEVVRPGGVILVRGGTYACPYTIRIDKSGEQGNPIRLAAYPGEVPILDFGEVKGESVSISGAYWHIKALAITHAMRPMMIHGSGAHHNILEQVRAFGNQHAGIFITTDGPANNLILNCDAYGNFDTQMNGQNADGFGICWNVGPGNVLIGNRSWNNSDDGYDCWFAGKSVRLERCYAWRNGENIWNHPFFEGNGNGFKLGGGEGRHVLIGCLVWGHSGTGCTLNGNTSGVIIRDCSALSNDTDYYFEASWWKKEAREGCVFSNNISYNGHNRNRINRNAISQNNSWDASLGLTLTDNDFLSLDDSMMSAPRNSDGSIPQNDFLKLAPTSKAIDAGIDIGMPFAGQRPDLGAFEYDPNEASQGYVKMLHQYVRDYDIEKIKALLAQDEGINDKDWLGYTPLQWAVYFGYPDVVELLLSQGADPNIQSDTGRYALDIARAMVYADIEALLYKHGAKDPQISLCEVLLFGDLEKAKVLIKSAGADVNIKNDTGQTPLDIALNQGNKEIIKLLLDNGAEYSSIHIAVQAGDRDQVKAFLDQGIDVDVKNEQGSTALFLAVKGKHEDIVKLLVAKGADVDAKDKQGKTALFYAVEHNHKDIVELLIAKGADVNAKEDGGYTPLYYALWYENKDLTTLLISKGAEVNVEPERDYPLIYYAVWNEDLDTVKLLVAKGAKFDVTVLNDQTAFHYAVEQGSRDIAEFLVSKGIDASTFHVAAGMGDVARVKGFVEQGADINVRDELGWTPLYWAASLGQIEVAKLLIDKGVDVRTAATDGGTALYQAAQAGDNELVELLLSKGADVKAKDKRGNTPLFGAASAGRSETVELLISKGADVNARDKRGNTPLFGAASAGRSEAVELLIAKGADVNARTKNNWTPLHQAALAGHKDVVEILIAHGADVTVKDSRGRTAWDWAKQRGHTEIVELLLKHQEKE
ncbi:MAG TPA: hypothetical protein DIU00_23365 [Phycisphaerales bacterium]|nr:hypothetical protein [Phycisphaerales bacterium]